MKKSPFADSRVFSRSNTGRSLLNTAILFGGSILSINAATTGNTFNFIINQTYGEVVSPEVFNTNFLTAAVTKFDTTLGTLESFTITWSLEGSYTGTLGTGGGVSSTFTGPLLIAGFGSPTIPSVIGGGGFGGGGGTGMVLTLPFTGVGNPLSFTQTLTAGEANAAVFSAVQGTGTVPLRWNTPLTIGGSWASLAVSGTASATILYTYSAVPESSSLAFGILALGSVCAVRKRR